MCKSTKNAKPDELSDLLVHVSIIYLVWVYIINAVYANNEGFGETAYIRRHV